ncbi:SDR family oxidoreductase [Paraburkholderia pallida]|uniref:SDR family oxidoreductase n=1 Tax=Paraburkholderia pallida TaxID=2547399 RepID=A0A4P7CQC0_9BURK|nr:SDR family oxidoreductase [Paraburkholderia pallida]QBQ96454.1 SDR family oxidoreductase [Paraburkholderia pallida]
MKKQQRVLITGAGRGIGFAIARLLAAEGYDLVLNYRSEQGKSIANLQRFLQSDEAKGVDIRLAKGDIAETRDIENMMKALRAEGVEQIDHLVLNAASSPFKPFLDMNKFDWKLLLNSNLVGNVACVNEVVPMMKDGGTICILSSMGSRVVMPKYPLGIMKSALENLVRYLEVELYDRNVRVNGVCAGLVNTDMGPILKEMWPEAVARFEAGHRRWAIEPEEVAEIVSFLISPKSSAIRGATVLADLGGGLSA